MQTGNLDAYRNPTVSSGAQPITNSSSAAEVDAVVKAVLPPIKFVGTVQSSATSDITNLAAPLTAIKSANNNPTSNNKPAGSVSPIPPSVVVTNIPTKSGGPNEPKASISISPPIASATSKPGVASTSKGGNSALISQKAIPPDPIKARAANNLSYAAAQIGGMYENLANNTLTNQEIDGAISYFSHSPNDREKLLQLCGDAQTVLKDIKLFGGTPSKEIYQSISNIYKTLSKNCMAALIDKDPAALENLRKAQSDLQKLRASLTTPPGPDEKIARLLNFADDKINDYLLQAQPKLTPSGPAMKHGVWPEQDALNAKAIGEICLGLWNNINSPNETIKESTSQAITQNINQAEGNLKNHPNDSEELQQIINDAKGGIKSQQNGHYYYPLGNIFTNIAAHARNPSNTNSLEAAKKDLEAVKQLGTPPPEITRLIEYADKKIKEYSPQAASAPIAQSSQQLASSSAAVQQKNLPKPDAAAAAAAAAQSPDLSQAPQRAVQGPQQRPQQPVPPNANAGVPLGGNVAGVQPPPPQRGGGPVNVQIDPVRAGVPNAGQPVAGAVNVNVAPVNVQTNITQAEFDTKFNEVHQRARANKLSSSQELVDLYDKVKDKVNPKDFKVKAELATPPKVTRGINKNGLPYYAVDYKQTVTINNTNPPVTKEINRTCYILSDSPSKALLTAKKFIEKQAEMVEASIDTTKVVPGFDRTKQSEYFGKAMFCNFNKDGSGTFRLSTDNSTPGVTFGKTNKTGPKLPIQANQPRFETVEEEMLHTPVAVSDTQQINVNKDFNLSGYLQEANERITRQKKAAEDSRAHFLAREGGRIDKAVEFVQGNQYAGPLKDMMVDQGLRLTKNLNSVAKYLGGLKDKENLNRDRIIKLSGDPNFLEGVREPLTREAVVERIKAKRSEIDRGIKTGKLNFWNEIAGEESQLRANHKEKLVEYNSAKAELETQREKFNDEVQMDVVDEVIDGNGNGKGIYANNATILNQDQVNALNAKIKTHFGIENKFQVGATAESVKKFFSFVKALQGALGTGDFPIAGEEIAHIKKLMENCGLPTNNVRAGMQGKELLQILKPHASNFIEGSDILEAINNFDTARTDHIKANTQIKERAQFLVNSLNQYRNQVAILEHTKAELTKVQTQARGVPELNRQGADKVFQNHIEGLAKDITRHKERIAIVEKALTKIIPNDPQLGGNAVALGGPDDLDMEFA